MNNTLIGSALVILIAAVGGWYYFSATPTSQMAAVENSTSTSSTTVTTGTPATTTLSAVKEFTVTGKNYSFDPKTITVKKGDTVKIVFKNADGFHDFVIDAFGKEGESGVRTKQIKAGAEETIEFVADTAGSYEYYCSVGKHREMGMKGTLIVE